MAESNVTETSLPVLPAPIVFIPYIVFPINISALLSISSAGIPVPYIISPSVVGIGVNSSAKRNAFKFDSSIVYPPIRPPSNKTFEPVICPSFLNFNISPTDTPSFVTNKPPTLPPVKLSADAVTSPFAFTLKLVDDMNRSFPVAEPLMKKLFDDNASSVILNPPIVPALAVIVPCIVTSPFGDKWKFDELISMLPFEPLIYCDFFVPTKNLSTSIRALEPLTNNSLDMLSQTNCASDEPLPK